MQSEADRRQNLVDDLLTREKQLNATFKGEITEPENPRYTTLAEDLSCNESEMCKTSRLKYQANGKCMFSLKVLH